MAPRFLRLSEHDFKAICAIEQAAHPKPWSNTIVAQTLAQGYPFIGIETQGKLCGFAVLQQVVDEAQILNLCIHPEYQHQGLGTMLLGAVLQQACTQGVVRVYLEVRVSNQNAQRLYTRAGFVKSGVRVNYYPLPEGGREDALLMHWFCHQQAHDAD